MVPRYQGKRSRYRVQDTRYENSMSRFLYLKTNCVTPFLTLSQTSAPRLLARLLRQPPVFSALSSDLQHNIVIIEVKIITNKWVKPLSPIVDTHKKSLHELVQLCLLGDLLGSRGQGGGRVREG